MKHHFVPQKLQKNDKTVTVCANCHKKLHILIDPLVELIIDPHLTVDDLIQMGLDEDYERFTILSILSQMEELEDMECYKPLL